ncbi:DUF6053 domain-containing protein [Lysobacter sp. CA199]
MGGPSGPTLFVQYAAIGKQSVGPEGLLAHDDALFAATRRRRCEPQKM